MRLVIALCLAALLAAGCGEDKKPAAPAPAKDQGKQPQPPPGKNRDNPGFN